MFDRDPVLKNVLQGGFDIQDEVGGELERERERERVSNALIDEPVTGKNEVNDFSILLLDFWTV